MTITMAQYQESAQWIQKKLEGFTPEVAIILGSGLEFHWEDVKSPISLPYTDIPHIPASTAPGHAGRFIFGVLAGKKVAIMQGRHHFYEGYHFQEVTYSTRVLNLLGCRTLIVTNAAGCVNTQWQAGDLMLITDQLKLSLESPLCGPNLSEFGVRFPDMTQLYTPRLQAIAQKVAQDQGILLRQGVYCYFTGPQYETPAEIRAVRILGGDAVGMSTAPEAIVAAHGGMDVLGFSLLTNMAAGILEQPLSEEEVLIAAKAGKSRFVDLVLGCLAQI